MKMEEIARRVSDVEYAVLDPDSGMFLVFSKTFLKNHSEERIKRIYRCIKGDEWVLFELDKAIKQIVMNLKKKVNITALLSDVIRSSPPKEIVKAFNELQKPQPVKIVARSGGCYHLNIGEATFALNAKYRANI